MYERRRSRTTILSIEWIHNSSYIYNLECLLRKYQINLIDIKIICLLLVYWMGIVKVLGRCDLCHILYLHQGRVSSGLRSPIDHDNTNSARRDWLMSATRHTHTHICSNKARLVSACTHLHTNLGTRQHTPSRHALPKPPKTDVGAVGDGRSPDMPVECVRVPPPPNTSPQSGGGGGGGRTQNAKHPAFRIPSPVGNHTPRSHTLSGARHASFGRTPPMPRRMV